VLKHPTSPDQIAFTGGNMAFTSVNPDDSQLFSAALHNWQERNHTARTFLALTPAEQSEILRDAQDLKTSDKMSPEGRRNRDECERILRSRSTLIRRSQ
jgi:hypothetical protein